MTQPSEPSLFSLTLSLAEKEQRLLVLQEADSVRQQELSSLRQDMQEAQAGQKELSAQVFPTPLRALFLGGNLLLESAGDCSVTLRPQQPWQEGEARTGLGGAWEPDPELRTDPVGNLMAQNTVPRGAELTQAWFKPSRCQVCLVCLARHSRGNQYYSRRGQRQPLASRDSVCSQQDPRPCAQRKDGTGRRIMRK